MSYRIELASSEIINISLPRVSRIQKIDLINSIYGEWREGGGSLFICKDILIYNTGCPTSFRKAFMALNFSFWDYSVNLKRMNRL